MEIKMNVSTRKVKRQTPPLTWDYDSEADVMYITFGKPLPCRTLEPEPGICLRYHGKYLNGLTVIDYSRRTTKIKP
jgi:uncharacterized protein YuzE